MPVPDVIRNAIPDRFRRYLPTVQERGKYTGPFSTFAEYHGLGVGFAGGVTDPTLLAPVVAYGMGNGAGKVRRSGHFRDAAKELAYVGLGAALGIAVRNPSAISLLPFL